MGYARFRHGSRLLALAAATAIMVGCDAGRQGDGRTTHRSDRRTTERITILSYNVQNLFDATDDGSEYAEFDPERGAWTAEAADAKASRIARVIRRAVHGGPDVLCLQEVEHGRVVADLARDHLRRRGYRYAAVSETPGSAVEVALLSRLPIGEARVHAPVRGWPRRQPDGEEAGAILRPVLEVRLETEGGPLHLFVNHWKSKSGGARETEPARRAAARVVARRMRAITADDPGAEIVLCGDLNESPRAFDEAGGTYPTALMPLGAGELSSAAHALRVSGDPAAVRQATSAAVLYS
ncbi:MAG: endonuclease/exonuclease/phosphatase family protein [Spirochaetia bacterium]